MGGPPFLLVITMAGDKARLKSGLKAAGQSLSDYGRDEMDQSSRGITPVQYRHGGKVRKTGPAILHKNERVIPANKRRKVERLMKRSKMRMKSR